MNRRHFLQTFAAMAAAGVLVPTAGNAANGTAVPGGSSLNQIAVPVPEWLDVKVQGPAYCADIEIFVDGHAIKNATAYNVREQWVRVLDVRPIAEQCAQTLEDGEPFFYGCEFPERTLRREKGHFQKLDVRWCQPTPKQTVTITTSAR